MCWQRVPSTNDPCLAKILLVRAWPAVRVLWVSAVRRAALPAERQVGHDSWEDGPDEGEPLLLCGGNPATY